jgi:hypothetical protein
MSSDHLPNPHTVRKSRVENRPGAVVVVRPQVAVDPQRDRRGGVTEDRRTRFTDAPPAINADAA